jgi:tetratricopeptide (TPR) repeat protein
MGLILGALIARVAPLQENVPRRIGVLLVGVVLVAGGGLWLGRSRAFLVHGQNGVERLAAGDSDNAIRELQKSVRQRPDFIAAHAALARAYIVKRDYDNAAAEMKRVITLDPRNESAYYQLGLIYLSQKQPAKAEDAFTQLLKINPNSTDGRAGRAGALSDQHRNAEALAEYKRVADIDSLYQGVYYNMGVMEARLNQYGDAIASLLKQRQTEDDADNENLLAAVYEAKGMQREAQDARQKAAQFHEQK